MNSLSAPKVLRFKEATQAVGLSRSTLYRLIAADSFVPVIRLSTHAVGFHERDIASWLANREVVRVTTGEVSE